MQNSMTFNAAQSEETSARRSAILAALYALAICATLIVGIIAIVAYDSNIILWISIALSAYLSDPLRQHLSVN